MRYFRSRQPDLHGLVPSLVWADKAILLKLHRVQSMGFKKSLDTYRVREGATISVEYVFQFNLADTMDSPNHMGRADDTTKTGVRQ